MPSLLVFLLAATLLVILLRAVRKVTTGELTLGPIPVTSLAISFVITGLAVGHLTDLAARFRSYPLPETVAPNRGIDDDVLIANGIDQGFIPFLTAHIPPDDRYVIVCEVDPCDDTKRFLLTVRLPPRVPVATVDQADWIVFVGVRPDASKVPDTGYTDAITYAPGLTVARAARATP